MEYYAIFDKRDEQHKAAHQQIINHFHSLSSNGLKIRQVSQYIARIKSEAGRTGGAG
jgi:hypothetical protein